MSPTHSAFFLAAALLLACPLHAQQPERAIARPEDTEIWEPEPPVVTPGDPVGTSRPPSDAILLFDGSGLGEWVNVSDGQPAGWTISGNELVANQSSGSIQTRRNFRDYQLHIEWLVPRDVIGEGQHRGNSGVYLALAGEPKGGYEVQVLDSYRNRTYVNGMAGAIYKQSIPLANPSRPPGQWQAYDIVWRAPRFAADGSLESPARVTVFFNGVLVQNVFELKGETLYSGTPAYRAHGPAPIMLQAHGDPGPPVHYRNIWLREL